MFKRFAISPKLLEAAMIIRVTNAQARMLGIVGKTDQDMSGVAFPYIDPVTGEAITHRIRRDNPEIKDGKSDGKYMCPAGKQRALYFPPGAREMLEEPGTPVVLAEAEKSSLALTAWAVRNKLKLLAVAMGGCWGWMENNGEGKASTPLADLNFFKGRLVYIMLDANAETNRQVKAAREALVKELLKLNCTVLVANLPQVEGVNGPDDLISLHDGDKLLKDVMDGAMVPSIAPYSEDNLARRFTEEHGKDWLYVASWGKWMHWDGSRWKQDETEEIYHQIRMVCRNLASECHHPSVAQRVGSAKTVRAVELLARTDRSPARSVV
jgi:hypothetical protein